MFERIIHVCEFAEIFGHRVEFVVFNSPANGTVLFGNIHQVTFLGKILIKFFDRSVMEFLHLVGDDACRVSVLFPEVREKILCFFFAERVFVVSFADERFLDVLEPDIVCYVCYAEWPD